jgi:hypothetical protein
MKKIIILLLISASAFGQNFDDSTITIQLTQRAAYWIGNGVRISPEWSNRKIPDIFKSYVGNGTKPDSLFTVTLKAKFLIKGIDLLMGSRTQVGMNDYRAIISNMPTVQGYTGLASQIVTKASQGDLTAIYIRDWYNSKVALFQALYEAEKAAVIEWSKN